MTDESLNFDAAQPSAAQTGSLACSVCSRPITGAYHMANQAIVCSGCRAKLAREMGAGSGSGRLARALLFGLGGALVGAAIYYAVLALTGYEVGLIAILVGWLVGMGVHKGSNGRGGLVYQVMAVVLTYFAIVSTYVPLIMSSWREMASDTSQVAMKDSTLGLEVMGIDSVLASPAAAKDSAALTDVTADSLTAAGAAAAQPTIIGAIVGMIFLLGFAAALPFLAGVGNIIGLLIIGFALYQAWKMNKANPIEFSGPYQVAPAPEPPPA